MKQIGTFKLTTEWQNVENFTTISNNKTYYIQNQGPATFVYREELQTPNKKDSHGNRVIVDDKLIHIKDVNNLYLRALNNNTQINIMEGD